MKKSNFTKIGVVGVLSIAILVWGINYLKGLNFFDKESRYFVVYEKVDGLVPSSAVVINGFRVGQVKDINFVDVKSAKLLVEFMMDENIPLPINTVARIFSSDLMGTMAIELVLSDSDSAYHLGDTLPGDIEGSLREQVSMEMLPLKNKAEDLMQEFEEAIEIVKFVFNESSIDNLTKSIASIKQTIQNLEASSFTLDTLLQEEKSKLVNIFNNIESISLNLKNNNQKINTIIKNFADVSDSIAQSNIKTTIQVAENVLSETNKVIEKINRGEGSLGLLLKNDTLYNNLEDAAYNMNKLVEDLRINPRRYIHFALFDMGKTVYQIDEDLNKTQAEGEGRIKYKIQIASSNTPIPLNPANFKGIKNVEEFIDGGTYKYAVGNKRNIEKAIGLLEEIRITFPDAFIIAFKDGERINLKKALEEE
ncbi:MAG: MlaD family protein [Bacteroidota bacterium]